MSSTAVATAGVVPSPPPTPPPVVTPRQRVEAFFYRPTIAVPLCFAIMALALWFSPWAWNCLPGLKQHPILTRTVVPGLYVFLIVLSRYVSRPTLTIANVLCGSGMLLLLAGWKAFGICFVLSVLTYYVFLRRLPTAWAMLACLLGIFGSAFLCSYVKVAPMWGGPATRGTLGALGLGAMRMLLYLFDYPVIRRRGGKFLDFLSYGQFGLILWAASPTACYEFYGVAQRDKTDRMGSAQLIVGAAKTLAWCIYLWLIIKYVPDITTLFTWSVSARALFLYAALVMWILRCAPWDLATGVGNLCGFRCPWTFGAPLLAPTLFTFWQRWFIPVNDFMLRIGAYPLARRFRKPWVRALMLFWVVSFIRIWWHNIFFAYITLPTFDTLVPYREVFGTMGAFVALLVVGTGMDAAINRYKLLKFPGWVLTSAATAWLIFAPGDNFTQQWDTSDDLGNCVHDHYWNKQIQCPPPAAPDAPAAPAAPAK